MARTGIRSKNGKNINTVRSGDKALRVNVVSHKASMTALVYFHNALLHRDFSCGQLVAQDNED